LRAGTPAPVDLDTLFVPDEASAALEREPPSGDVAAVGSLLLGVTTAMPASAIADALDWTRQRAVAALEQLGDELAHVGMRLSRNGNGVGITRALEPVTRRELANLVCAHINRDGLDRSEAAMLRRIATVGTPKQPSNPDTVGIGALINAGLVEPGDPPKKNAEAPLVLTAAARFSPLYDDAVAPKNSSCSCTASAPEACSTVA
jgi:hypothetical protein